MNYHNSPELATSSLKRIIKVSNDFVLAKGSDVLFGVLIYGAFNGKYIPCKLSSHVVFFTSEVSCYQSKPIVLY